MSDRTTHPPPRTVYMTDDLWNDIEQAHMELRLAAPQATPRSKIEFTQEVIRVGLAELRRRLPPPPASVRVPTEAETPPAAPQVEEVPAAPPSPSARAPQSPRRSAADRLREASNPGRPARIQSAAGSPEGAAGRSAPGDRGGT